MNFMGMGPLEILLILILGFLFFGPEKLPSMAAKAGKYYRNFKKASFDVTRSFTNTLSDDEKSIGKDMANLSNTLNQDLSNISKTIKNDLLGSDNPDKKPKTTATAKIEIEKTETSQAEASISELEERQKTEISLPTTPVTETSE